MKVLIVESDPDLGRLWQRHLMRHGMDVRVETGQARAVLVLQVWPVDVIVLNLVLAEGSALAVADYACYRHPEAHVIFVNNTSFFSDGSIFKLCANARAYVQSSTPPEDLAAMVAYYGRPALLDDGGPPAEIAPDA